MHIFKLNITAPSIQRLFLTLSLLGFISASPIGLTTAAERAASRPCETLSGTFTFTDFHYTSATTAEATALIWDGERVIGTATAKYFNIEQQGNGVVRMNGMHTLTFEGGTLDTFDEIHLLMDKTHPAVGRANSRLYIIGGTGTYAGVAGVLHTHGTVNFFTLEGGIDFKGRVCTE